LHGWPGFAPRRSLVGFSSGVTKRAYAVARLVGRFWHQKHERFRSLVSLFRMSVDAEAMRLRACRASASGPVHIAL